MGKLGNKDWWLGRTPEQKAARQANNDRYRQRINEIDVRRDQTLLGIQAATDPAAAEIKERLDRRLKEVAAAGVSDEERVHLERSAHAAAMDELDDLTVLRPDVAEAAGRLESKLGTGRELKRLRLHLRDDETVGRLAAAKLGGSLAVGLLVATDQRLLFVEEALTQTRTESFDYGPGTTVEWSPGAIRGSVIATAAGARAEFKHVPSVDGAALVAHIRAVAGAPSATPAAAPSSDAIDQLRRLGDLHQGGILTDDEFAAKKAELLGRL